MPRGVYTDEKAWTPESIIELRKLVADGHTARKIGDMTGRGKYSIIGKCRREGIKLATPNNHQARKPVALTSEDVSKINALLLGGMSMNEVGQRFGVSSRVICRVSRGVRQPNPGGRNVCKTTVQKSLPPLTTWHERPAPPKPVIVAPRPLRTAPTVYARIVSCCWPVGEPKRSGFRFCDAESVPGKPYCADHCSVAFVRVRDKRENEARA